MSLSKFLFEAFLGSAERLGCSGTFLGVVKVANFFEDFFPKKITFFFAFSGPPTPPTVSGVAASSRFGRGQQKGFVC